MTRYKRSWQENLVFAVDAIVIALCYCAVYVIRFDGIPPAQYLQILKTTIPIIIAARLAAILYFNVHKSRFGSMPVSRT